VAVRELQGAIKSLVVAFAIAASAALTLLCVGSLVTPLAEAGAPRLALVLLVVATAAIVAPTAVGAGPLVDRLLFGRRRRLWEELQQFLGSLAPQDGATECCRRAIAEVVRALGLRGAAIVLRDGEVVVHGNMPGAEELARVWPRGEALDALPGSSFDPSLLNRLPTATVEALIGAGIIGYLMITSPRRRWGTIFGTSGLIEPSPADEPVLEAFAAQLALVLDTTALLEHTVAVERSLAHAEKLAAIGEVAARIAHEIRNPVTAARSLAQLMERDPTAPENVESASLILSELERVERHVRDLLRFARREEYASDPVDLGDLARDALGPFVPRLAAAEVAVAVAATPGIVVRGDREKLRQVLVNLVENALDALGDVPERRLDLAVERNGDRATLRVTDSGRGIPSDALPRVFEPFFSTKETGTGLGLAIVRRIIDAHGGRITAEPGLPRGTTFRVDLPA
jgi:signal transduction histidine kinase